MNNLYDLLISMTNYLSAEELFALYISSKNMQVLLDDQFLINHDKTFISWLRDYYKKKERYQRRLRKLEKDLEKKRFEKEYPYDARAERIKRREQAPPSTDTWAKEQKRHKREQDENEQHNIQQSILNQLNIHDRGEWKLWLLKNHPDKGGDTELAALVVEEGRRMGY